MCHTDKCALFSVNINMCHTDKLVHHGSPAYTNSLRSMSVVCCSNYAVWPNHPGIYLCLYLAIFPSSLLVVTKSACLFHLIHHHQVPLTGKGDHASSAGDHERMFLLCPKNLDCLLSNFCNWCMIFLFLVGLPNSFLCSSLVLIECFSHKSQFCYH